MRNFQIFISACLLYSCVGNGQKMPYDENTKLELALLDSQVFLNPGDQWLTLNVSLTNKSNEALLLYEFKLIDPGSTPIEGSMQPNWTVQNCIFAFKDSTLLTIFNIQEFLELRLSETIRQEKLILKPNQTWSGKLRALVDKDWLLHQKYFEERENIIIAGEYELFLIYNCGVNIVNLVPENLIREDERTNKAILFQGYVRSNTIKLIVRPND